MTRDRSLKHQHSSAARILTMNRMTIRLLALMVVLSLQETSCAAFHPIGPLQGQHGRTLARGPLFAAKDEKPSLWQGVASLWDEIIEVSTYGPSERKILKARREAKAQREADDDDDLSLDNFRRATSQLSQESTGDESSPSIDFDGYAMRDLLVEKWGASLDIDFQRQPGAVYCTVLPVAFGSRKCRHEAELEYLMHLQGIVEVLHKYNNLDLFINFIITTSKVPKVGTDSVPFRLELSDEDLQTIL